MLRAWRGRDRFRGGTKFKAWIYTIMRNGFFSAARRNKYAGEWDEKAAEIQLSAKADQDRRLHVYDVQRALSCLPDVQREALVLVGAEQLTYEEVAEITAVPIGTVKSRINRGRAALIRLIEGDEDRAVVETASQSRSA